MRLILVGSTLLSIALFTHTAKADNALTQDQLVKATQQALKELTTSDPDMAPSVSGFRVSTLGKNAQVTVDMNADGMKMSTKYLCVAQATEFSCNVQQ